MDQKIREKSKAVFRTILKNCEDLRKAEVSENELGKSENSGHASRRFNLPQHTRRS